MRAHYLLALLPPVLVTGLQAQLPTVDIRMAQLQPDRYEVRLRPDDQFDGFFSSMVFTLRWSASSSGTLAEFAPSNDMLEIGIYPALSGDVIVAGPYQYAIHAAFGLSSLASQGLAWSTAQEIVVGTIDVIGGPIDLELVNDGWTAANNGDFFVSLNGLEQTGVIYSISTALDEVIAVPNPWEVTCLAGSRPVQFIVTSDITANVTYSVIDATGRMVDQGRTTLAKGRNELSTQLSEPAPGAYTLRIGSAAGNHASKHLIIP